MNEEKAAKPTVRTETEERISELLITIETLAPINPEKATEVLFRLCRIFYPSLTESTKELLMQLNSCPTRDSKEPNRAE